MPRRADGRNLAPVSDRQQRDLERRAASGDPAAEEALIHALRRDGTFERLEARLAAALREVQQPAAEGLEPRDLAVGLIEVLGLTGARRSAALVRSGTWRVLENVAPLGPVRCSFGLAQSGAEVVQVTLGICSARDVERFDALEAPRAADLQEWLSSAELVAHHPLEIPLPLARTWCLSLQPERLPDLRHMRRHPAMWVGDRGLLGVHVLFEEVLANAIDEVARAPGTRIDVTLHADGSCTIGDDGRGFAPDRHPRGRSALEHAFLSPLDDSWRPPSRVTETGRPRRISMNLGIVGGLCASVQVETALGSRRVSQAFARGDAARPATFLAEGRPGTEIRFRPDPEVFTAGLEPDRIAARLEEVAHLAPGVRVTLGEEQAAPSRREWLAPAGVAGLVHSGVDGSLRQEALLAITGGTRELGFEAALAWADGPRLARLLERFAPRSGGPLVWYAPAWPDSREGVVLGYVNRSACPLGSHVRGLRRAVRRGLKALRSRREDPCANLVAAVHAWAPEVAFEGSTRERLAAPEIERLVERTVADLVRGWARRDPARARAAASGAP